MPPAAAGGLTELLLSHAQGLTDYGLEHAALSMPRLQRVVLAGCRGITDSGLAEVAALQCLAVLDLTDVRQASANTHWSLPAILPTNTNQHASVMFPLKVP